MQRQTQELINFYVNYRSGIICRRHSSIAAARIEEDNASRKGGPPALVEVWADDGGWPAICEITL